MITDRGNIFDVQGFSVHDGPGCRTLVFLKGCTLKCKWCSNPEGQSQYLVPMYNLSKCIFCQSCIKVCPYNRIKVLDGKICIDRELCINCSEHNCAIACATGALKIAGYDISLQDLISKIERDRLYWGDKGGITLTGGEPLLQSGFSLNILEYCYTKYIHTAVETCGNINWDVYEQAVKYLDWIFFDIKFIDNEKHKMNIGQSNELILNNAGKLAETFKGRLVFRTVIVPDFNDTNEDIYKLVKFINKLKRHDKEINILPVHHLAKEKYKMLGLDYFSGRLLIPCNQRLKEIQNIFTDSGIKCYIKDDTPF